jgi:hypothetical protein
MLRSTTAIMVLLYALAPRPASAQQEILVEPSSYQLDDTGDIDAEHRAAIGLYISAACITVTGLGTGIVGVLGLLGLAGSGDMGMLATSIGGAVVAGLGLLLFVPAIVLDVDSNVRRGRRGNRTVALGVRGTGVSLEGRF